MTATETGTEAAFWADIGSKPNDALPRLVFADWLEENAKDVACVWCENGRRYGRDPLNRPGVGRIWYPCSRCHGNGFTPDGRVDLAAALRATAHFVPWDLGGEGVPPSRFVWVEVVWLSGWKKIPDASRLPSDVFRRLQKNGQLRTIGYPTAAAAIRDVCRAWVNVNRGRVKG